jgi:hypothetical protein
MKGELEDVEIEIGENDIAVVCMEGIQESRDQEFEKWKSKTG